MEIIVTKYDQLYKAFIQWDIEFGNLERRSVSAMLAFYGGFKRKLGFAASNDRIALHRIETNLSGVTNHTEVANFTDALVETGNGSYQFGMTVTLKGNNGESAPRAERFIQFYLDIRFILRQDECEFWSGYGESQRFRSLVNENDSGLSLRGKDDMFDYFIGEMKNVLRRKPWDQPETASIGFDLSSRNTR
jgi:hypothetical protein